jgi:hypothetical protein
MRVRSTGVAGDYNQPIIVSIRRRRRPDSFNRAFRLQPHKPILWGVGVPTQDPFKGRVTTWCGLLPTPSIASGLPRIAPWPLQESPPGSRYASPLTC